MGAIQLPFLVMVVAGWVGRHQQEVLTPVGLVRYFVLFVIDLETRKVQIAGIVQQPHGAWMKQVARNLTDAFDGFLIGKSYLIHDRDPLFTHDFCEVLRSSGVEPLKLPPKSPNLNAYAERYVLSIQSECLAKMIPLGERHLRRAVEEYSAHYHQERNHQGLGNDLIEKSTGALPQGGEIRRHERLGGVLNYYSRGAA